MRSRLLATLSGLALAAGVLVGGVLVPATAASAHCSGHGTHPDVYSAGGISFANGTNIRRFPHTSDCSDILGQGFPSQGIDVHCAVETGSLWLFVRNTSTGINGWARFDVLRYAMTIVIRDCVDAGTSWVIFAAAFQGTAAPGATYQRA